MNDQRWCDFDSELYHQIKKKKEPHHCFDISCEIKKVDTRNSP